MQWLNELPFADNRVLQIGFLAACGIAALIVLAIFYRLAFAHRLRVPGGRTRQPRLGLVDAFSLDGQRQLVLVRRDNVEHLVMIGGPNDVLVESQINRAVAPARESNQASPLLGPSAPVRRTEAAALAASAGRRSAGEGRRQGPGFAARAGLGCADRPNRDADRSRRRPLPRKRLLPFPPKRLRPLLPTHPFPPEQRAPSLARCASGDASRRSPPDHQFAAASGATRVPHSRARPCPRRSSPPTPRRTGALPFARHETAPARGPGNPPAPSPSRRRRRVVQRNRSRQPQPRKRGQASQR